LEGEANLKAQKEADARLEELRDEIKEKDDKLKVTRDELRDLRKKERDLDDRKENLDLEVSRLVNEEKRKIREEAEEKVRDEYKLKQREHEEQNRMLQDQVNVLQRKLEQGSERLQGEVQEIELEKVLKLCFPHDQINPVPKGKKGADILHDVYNAKGKLCGTIIWESKRTKLWGKDWITKLKADQRECKAELAVLLTTTLPKGVKNFTFLEQDQVWVTQSSSIVGLATALRNGLIEIATVRQASDGKQTKVAMLYDYLAGTEFRQNVKSMIDLYSAMRDDLEKEKLAMMATWAKREAQIQQVITNISEMYGGIQGIIGGSLPQIESLELKVLSDGIGSDLPLQ
jgi:hypothetical protein